MTRVEQQLHAAGYLGAIAHVQVGAKCVRGTIAQPVRDALLRDARLTRGPYPLLHQDVGDDLVELRCPRGTFGRRALQIVFDEFTGAFYADTDKFFAYDVAGFLGHNFGEVLPHWFQSLWRRRGQRPAEQLDARNSGQEDRRG